MEVLSTLQVRGARCAALLAVAATLAACSPEYNWRDYASPDAPYQILFPDRPATQSREIDLNGMKVKLILTATSVDGTMFAVGTGVAPDAASAEAALGTMKTALVRNINGSLQREQAKASASAGPAGQQRSASLDIEASGNQQGVPMKLIGHFEARGNRFYQVIVMGKASDLKREQADTFLTSFKPK
jgi:hypothetical protein